MSGSTIAAAAVADWFVPWRFEILAAEILRAVVFAQFFQRTSRSRGLLFYRLLAQAVTAPPVTCRGIAKRML